MLGYVWLTVSSGFLLDFAAWDEWVRSCILACVCVCPLFGLLLLHGTGIVLYLGSLGFRFCTKLALGLMGGEGGFGRIEGSIRGGGGI